jgi:hypothetical protein
MANVVKIEIENNYNVGSKATVTLDRLVFEPRVISKITIKKQTFDDGSDDMIVELFAGNIIIAVLTTSEDYTITTEDGENASYWIIRTIDFDSYNI